VSVATVVAGEAEAAAWDRFVDDHPGATGYHSWAWRQVFQRAFRHHPIYLVSRRAGAIVGVLPLVEMRSLLFGRFMVSLPFVNYGGVLATDNDVERELFEHASDIAAERRLYHIELRHFTQHFADAKTKWHKVTMLMPTTAPRNGIKWSSPAITPHNKGFGIPRKYIAVPIAVPKNALIRHIENRYVEISRSICRLISTAVFLSSKRGKTVTSLRKNRSPEAKRKKSKIKTVPMPTIKS